MRASDAPVGGGTTLARATGRVWPLLLSVFVLMVGGGLTGPLLGVRAESASFAVLASGAVLGLYYLGYAAGSFWVPRMVRAVGHVRVFAALASIASSAVIVHGIWVSPIPWALLRFVTGVCVAGLFIVSESWLHLLASPFERGMLLALYSSVVTGGMALGALLLTAADTNGVVLFVIGSVLISIAAVPVTLAPHDAPPPPPPPTGRISLRTEAPLGPVAAGVSGLCTGGALGYGAVFASRAGFGVGGASLLIASILGGAAVGQVPIGQWSDRTDRRRVMAVAGALIAVGSTLGVWATASDLFTLVLLGGLVLGAGAFSLYGLAFAHVADYVSAEHMVAAGPRLVLANGLGAAAGPFSAAVAIAAVGTTGYFALLGLVGTAFVAYVAQRLLVRDAVTAGRRSSFAFVASSATVAVVADLVSATTGLELPTRRRRRRSTDGLGPERHAADRTEPDPRP